MHTWIATLSGPEHPDKMVQVQASNMRTALASAFAVAMPKYGSPWRPRLPPAGAITIIRIHRVGKARGSGEKGATDGDR